MLLFVDSYDLLLLELCKGTNLELEGFDHWIGKEGARGRLSWDFDRGLVYFGRE